MGLIEKILTKFCRWFLVYRSLNEVVDKYLQRFYLLKTKYLGIYIHKIYRSDSDKDPHCHAWNFFSLVLKGRYLEENWYFDKDNNFIGPIYNPRGRFSFVFRKRRHIHKVLLADARREPIWTLIIRVGKSEPWGFYDTDNNGRYIPMEVYTKDHQQRIEEG